MVLCSLPETDVIFESWPWGLVGSPRHCPRASTPIFWQCGALVGLVQGVILGTKHLCLARAGRTPDGACDSESGQTNPEEPHKPFHGSHRLDLVMVRSQGIDNGAIVVSPYSVWYARVFLLFSASAMSDTGSKSFECALVSTLETNTDPDNGNYDYYTHYRNYTHTYYYLYYYYC